MIGSTCGLEWRAGGVGFAYQGLVLWMMAPSHATRTPSPSTKVTGAARSSGSNSSSGQGSRPGNGHGNPDKRRVLHVDLEQGDRLTRRRDQRLAAAMGVDLPSLGDAIALAVMPQLSLVREHFVQWPSKADAQRVHHSPAADSRRPSCGLCAERGPSAFEAPGGPRRPRAVARHTPILRASRAPNKRADVAPARRALRRRASRTPLLA